jgi:hypothetical protein
VPGNRGLWRKVKCLNRAEFVVVGWTEPERRDAAQGRSIMPLQAWMAAVISEK